MTENKKNWLVLLAIFSPFVLIGGILIYYSGPTSILSITTWFHPVFFQYSLSLALVSVAIVPLITFSYVVFRKGAKKERLRDEIPDDVWNKYKDKINKNIDKYISFKSFIGSISICVIVISFGSFIILLLKPLPFPIEGQYGLNYKMGANFLLLGPYIELFNSDDPKYYHNLILSLTAFQFGFLGAYVYFVTHLVRSYFTFDLTPQIFISSTVRIMLGSILSLVLSFYLREFLAEDGSYTPSDFSLLPVICFAIGYFPSRGLLMVDKVAGAALKTFGPSKYNSTSLSTLKGMSYAHQLRLVREGVDNVENLSMANPLDLTLRTGFSYRQLEDWIGQAWLRNRLGEDYDSFMEETGLNTKQAFQDFLSKWTGLNQKVDALDALCVGKLSDKKHKLQAILLSLD